MTTDALREIALKAAGDAVGQSRPYEDDIVVAVDAVLAAIRASGRLAPEVTTDTAYRAANELLLKMMPYVIAREKADAILSAIAPLIAAAAEAKHRDVLEGILVDVDFAIADHTDGSATLRTCRARIGIIRDYVLAAIRTGSAS